MNGYLMDTDTCVELLRGNGQVIERRRGVTGLVVTSEITAGELYFGAARSWDPAGNKGVVDKFLETLHVLPLGMDGARFFGGLKATLRAGGRMISDADLWIASISRALRMTVVTGNGRHLSRVSGVVVEDWIRG